MEKQMIYAYCEQVLVARELQISEAIQSARKAANEDTKSSMGDKYETSREMMQQEINQLENHYSEVKKQLFQLRNIVLRNSAHIELGSLVYTDKGIFFILISLGEIIFENHKIMVISAISPLGKLMLGKRENEKMEINHNIYHIKHFQ